MKLKKIVAPVRLWKRVLAYFIDVMIVNIIIVFPFNDFFSNLEDDYFQFSKEILFVFILISVLTILYWSTMEYFLKQSVGKALLSIYVRSKDKELKFWQCIVRNIPKISMLLLLIDSFQVIFKKDYQRYFEKISRTEVIDDEL